MADNPSKPSVENQLIDSLLRERKRDRRWKVIRSFVWAFIVLLYAVLIFMPKPKKWRYRSQQTLRFSGAFKRHYHAQHGVLCP